MEQICDAGIHTPLGQLRRPAKPKAGDRTRTARAPLATMWNLNLIK